MGCFGLFNDLANVPLIGEVTPGLTQTEFEFRRQRLASLIEMQAERLTGSGASSDSSHIVIVLSHPIRYMTNDIPYPFHQNQDFLYLTGIMEPDSALVMYGSGKPDQAVLFVPRRDPARELWDGPRSGKDGAAALTGLERVHSTEELGILLKSIKGKRKTGVHLHAFKVYICISSLLVSPSLRRNYMVRQLSALPSTVTPNSCAPPIRRRTADEVSPTSYSFPQSH